MRLTWGLQVVLCEFSGIYKEEMGVDTKQEAVPYPLTTSARMIRTPHKRNAKIRDLGLPRGSEYPNSKVSGPKIHTLNGFWTLKPYYFGTWTLSSIAPSSQPAKDSYSTPRWAKVLGYSICISLRVHVPK